MVLATDVRSAGDVSAIAAARQLVSPNIGLGDVWRLMLVSDPRDIADRFDAVVGHPVLGPAIKLGRSYLTTVFDPRDGEGLTLAVDDLENYLKVSDVRQQIGDWMSAFIR